LEQTLKILKRNDIEPSVLPKDFDTRNKIPDWVDTPYDKNINAQTLLKLLGGDKIFAADVSRYENPDFIIDLNDPILDSSLLERFDTIVDVGTLEHIFDINSALDNIVNMLKVGGQLIIIVPASNAIDHGFYSFSPTLFFDYFSGNGFCDFSCYLREGSSVVYEKKSKLYEYLNVASELPIISKSTIEVAFSARKFESVSKIIKPYQSVYKNKSEWKKSSPSELSPAYNSNRELNKIHRFSQQIKFYGGKYCPAILEFIRLKYMRSKNRNIKYIGKF
jgi:hypothetical protein